MTYRSFFAVVLLALAVLPLTGWAQADPNSTDSGVNPLPYSRVGTSGWQFLKLPTDARSAAMGGVRSAVAYGDANAAFTNPASAADVLNFDAQFSSMRWVADIQYSGLSVVKNLQEWGTVGLNLSYLDYGSMVRTEISETGEAITQGLGTFSAHDLAVGFLYSRQITKQLQLGGNIRYIEEQLDDAKTGNWSVDIGTMYWTGLGSLRISMLGRNFGPDAEFSSYDERIQRVPVDVRMPMVFILGAAYDIMELSDESPHRLALAMEYVKPNDGPDKFNVGAEYFLMHFFYLRGGYRFNYDEETFTFGLGAEYTVADDIRLKVDYAYADLGRFDFANIFSIGIGF